MHSIGGAAVRVEVDSLGRVVLPQFVRMRHGIYPSGQVEFFVGKKALGLSVLDENCVICSVVHNYETGSSHKGRKVCGECWIGLVLIAEHSAIRSITGMT